ncbi:polyphosphate kinase [Campylobacter pinnipediorum subsp. caledonicus]|uniref:Polyphosphate kinase n=1 Tax=Campylobacter pinnipediorum subsp. caledonicus TaxID=1874362 RepID=A0A1S6U7U9_9BACT|nr:RNA degradosome polyphosphate kinase [Campylobacter pinnipediorum]AQW87537.1 polyphosphate kinase [Campylobacter pinnipediorum subsp. caledonicus]
MENQNIFINRELSWLRFNSRVLAQCEKDLPLLEKLKFLAIYSTNLDEFYMIRIAGLKQLFAAGITTSGSDEMSPLEQLKEIRKYLQNEQKVLEHHYNTTKEELSKNGLFIKNYNELNDDLKSKCDEYFFSNILPVIVPIAVDTTHPFPHLNNLSFSLAVKLSDINHPETLKYGMVRISRVLPRFTQACENTYVPIESIVQKHAEEIFPGYKMISSCVFRVTRNADIVIEEEEADDFMMILEQGLKLRRKGAFVRMQVAHDADPDILEFLNSHMKIFHKDIYFSNIPITLSSLWQIVSNRDFSHLCLTPYTPKTLPPFGKSINIFDAIDKEDVLLMHPYESFDPIVEFIKEASKDPKVISIRMTLYRVDKSSPIIQSLIDAASEGKQVTVMVELKARFDEENNLHWAKALEDAGAHVIYGITGFKVHAKVSQVIRQVNDKLKFYMHFGTGNYNGSSAKIYTDISLFTSKEEFANDTTTFFHILSGYNKNRRLQTLSMSPFQIKEKIIEKIRLEANEGTNGHIIAKINSLVDSDIIKELSKASNAGVKIELIVRGVCCLRPGIKGQSENIYIRSIIGKYLEHARVLYFKHSEPKLYISSADWMPRNLERRLELMTPIFDKKLQDRLLDMLKLQLRDNSLAFELREDGEYVKLDKENDIINSHEILENHINKIYKSIKKDNDKAKADLIASNLLRED